MRQILYRRKAIDFRKIEMTGQFEAHIVGTQKRFTSFSGGSAINRAKRFINNLEKWERENEKAITENA